MATNKPFIGERTAGKINRANPETSFLSNTLKGTGRVEAYTANGCAYDTGEDPGEFFEQGARSGIMSTYRRKLYGGNRTGE